MARIEKTVFISYRRIDVYTALAVYENLKNHGYDVFFDYRSIPSGDFEQIIISNIKARAHFILILTPTALNRCNDPGDWLRREIEIAMDEKRNVVPLFFKGFRFDAPSVTEKLTGKLKNLSRYNGLNVHEDYFDEAMHRLRTQYLNIPLNTILHPVSTEVQKVVREEQVAADKALEQIEDVKELVKHVEERPNQPNAEPNPQRRTSVPAVDVPVRSKAWESRIPNFSFNYRGVIGIAGGLLVISLLIWGGLRLFRNPPAAMTEPTSTTQTDIGTLAQTSPAVTSPPEQTITPSPTETSVPATPTLGIGSTMISDKDGMTLLYVPPGEFMMGSESGGSDEKPVHTVNLDAFWIDQTEVTNNMYSLCVSADVCIEPASTRSLSRSSYYGDAEYNNYPVVYVDWNSANSYCKWVDRRLPTEAEWEKAASWDAKNQTKNVYPWGDFIDCSFANYYGGRACVGDTTKVGSYESGRSPYGVYDMAGNVWEWVADWYDESYYSTLGEIVDNPQGPPIGQHRVLRGGSWYYSDVASYIGWGVPSADRSSIDPSRVSSNIGFRCAMSATP